MRIERLFAFVVIISLIVAIVTVLVRRANEKAGADVVPDKVVNQSWTKEYTTPKKVLVGDQVVLSLGKSVWIPNPFVVKHDESKREGRLAIPIDGMELFEHGIYDGGDMDKTENEQYIKGSGMNEANWSGVLDIWSPEAMEKNWAAPGSTIKELVHSPTEEYRIKETNKRIEHGFQFANTVLHHLFDLVIQENPIFQNFSPAKNTINAQKFAFEVYDNKDGEIEAEEDAAAY